MQFYYCCVHGETVGIQDVSNLDPSNKYLIALTFFGPVFTSVHSEADALIWRRGSSHETPKYIDIDMVWKKDFLFVYLFRKMRMFQ